MDKTNKVDNIVLKIPKKSEYMSTIRLTTSSIANLKSFNVDEIEDIKVLISEICTFFINNITENSEGLKIIYKIYDNKINVSVTDLNNGQLSEKYNLNSDMSIMIIESLSDSYIYNLNNKTITFEKANGRWL